MSGCYLQLPVQEQQVNGPGSKFLEMSLPPSTDLRLFLERLDIFVCALSFDRDIMMAMPMFRPSSEVNTDESCFAVVSWQLSAVTLA